MKSLVAAVLAGLFASVASAQSASMQSWIRSQYPDAHRVTVQTVLRDASIAGIAQTPAARKALKDALASIRGKSRFGLANMRVLEMPLAQSMPDFGADTIDEHEFNDSWQWADTILGGSVHGNCADLNDVDSWKFVSTGGFYTIDVSPQSGSAAITDSVLTLRNAKGDVVAVSDNVGSSLFSQISIYLPAGTYYADVASYLGTHGGIYNLAVSADPVAMRPLAAPGAAGTTAAANTQTTHDVYDMLVTEGRVNLRVVSGVDSQLTVQRADGVVVFSNDDSSFGLDAAADIDLPAGRYFVHVNEVTGAAGVPFLLQMAQTPGTLVDAIAAGTTVENLVGDQSMRLVKVDLSAAAGKVTLTTSDNGATPVLDTVLSLYDRDLDFVCDVDDDNASDPLRGFYSRISANLPAGVYYAAVTPFTGMTGGYSLSAATTAFQQTGSIGFGPRPQSTLIAGHGDVTTYRLDNLTQVSAKMTSNDFYFTFLGNDGQLASCQRGTPDFPQAGEIPEDGGYVLVWDRFDYTGPLDVAITPALHFTGNQVEAFAKEGDWVFYLAQFHITPGPRFNFGVGDRGYLLMHQNPYLVTFAVQQVPASGRLGLWTPPVLPFNVLLQTLDLHTGSTWPAPALATWRNLIQL
jgi:hypothetical protein